MEEKVANQIACEALTVPDVYALVYGDEVDWDAELAELIAAQSEAEVEALES